MDIRAANVWRTNFAKTQLGNIFAGGAYEKPPSKYEDAIDAIVRRSFTALKDEVTKLHPDTFNFHPAVTRIEILNPEVYGPDTNRPKS